MTYTPKKNYRSFKQVRPIFMTNGIEQITNGLYTLELFKRAYGKEYEIRFEYPNGTTGWGQVLSDGTLSGVDLFGIPQYVRDRAVRMWHDMEAVMRDGS